MAKRDLALDLFHSFKGGKKKQKRLERESGATPTNEPQSLKDLLAHIVHERDWKAGVAEGTLYSTWTEVVGAEIARHATPISLLDGVLTIQTSSTAWAVQLQLVGSELLTTIRGSSPGALVELLSIIGPNGPSWKKGVRTIKGARGPRDTYG